MVDKGQFGCYDACHKFQSVVCEFTAVGSWVVMTPEKACGCETTESARAGVGPGCRVGSPEDDKVDRDTLRRAMEETKPEAKFVALLLSEGGFAKTSPRKSCPGTSGKVAGQWDHSRHVREFTNELFQEFCVHG